MLVNIIDYGAGNIHSLKSALLKFLKEDQIIICRSAEDIKDPTHIILPGVGAFDKAMDNLRAVPNLIELLEKLVLEEKVPFLGICVGMQVLADKGLENKETKGLGWIEGEVRAFVSKDHKIPHMGWNNIKIMQDCKNTYDFIDGQDFYFVHSYYFKVRNESNILAKASYTLDFPAIVAKDNILACQFHPEKSGEKGLAFIKFFLGK